MCMCVFPSLPCVHTHMCTHMHTCTLTPAPPPASGPCPSRQQAGLGRRRWRAWRAGVQGWSGGGALLFPSQACPPPLLTYGASLSASQTVPAPSLERNRRPLSLKLLTSETRSGVVLFSRALAGGPERHRASAGWPGAVAAAKEGAQCPAHRGYVIRSTVSE